MKPSEDLFDLIQTMSQAEKRYFSLRAEQHTGSAGNNNVLLFKAIDRQTVYDESKLKAKLKGQTLARNLAAAKYQLYQNLLKSLTEYRASKSNVTQLREMINQIENLQQRGLHVQASQLLKKAKQLAETHEYFLPLAELLDLEYSLTENSASTTIAASLIDISDQTTAVSLQLANLQSYRYLRTRITTLRKQASVARDVRVEAELEAVLQHPLLADVEQALSKRARRSFYRICAEAAVVNQAYSQAIQDYAALMLEWEQVPRQEQSELRHYRRDMVNYLNVCLRAWHPETIENLLKRVRALKLESAIDSLQAFQDNTHIELLFCMQTGNFERGYELSIEIEAGLERYAGKLSISRVLTLCINLAVFALVTARYTAALAWLERLLQTKPLDIRQDLRARARIFLPIIHFELGNVEILDSLLRSARRHLQANKATWDYELCVVKHLNRIATIPESQHRQHYDTMAAELAELQSAAGNSPLPGLNEILFWIESKLRRTTLSDVVLEKISQAKQAGSSTP